MANQQRQRSRSCSDIPSPGYKSDPIRWKSLPSIHEEPPSVHSLKSWWSNFMDGCPPAPTLLLWCWSHNWWLDLTTNRLPSSVTVAIQSPWSPTDCPLCAQHLPTARTAHLHFKRKHLARTLAFLCLHCNRRLPTLAHAATHAGKCRPYQTPRNSPGQAQCEYCLRAYKTQRGLNIHIR